MTTKETIKTGIKKSTIIYEDWDTENRLLEDVEKGVRKPRKSGNYDEIRIRRKIYHDHSNCHECHKQVQKIFQVDRATFSSQKCMECMMKWLDRKNPEFKSELTSKLL